MNYSQYVPEYEAQIGKKASEVLNRFASAMDYLEEKGRRAAQDGKQPLVLSDFVSWIHQGKDPYIAELMFECYMDGYNAGKASA